VYIENGKKKSKQRQKPRENAKIPGFLDLPSSIMPKVMPAYSGWP
jgi:hypothetical protein